MAGILEAEKDVKSSIVKQESTEVYGDTDSYFDIRVSAKSRRKKVGKFWLPEFLTTVITSHFLVLSHVQVPNCLDLFYKWRFCASSSNQFHHYYIYGTFQDCAMYRQDMTNCILWKTTKSEDARKALMEGVKRDEVKFTSGSVWEKRENPSDSWR